MTDLGKLCATASQNGDIWGTTHIQMVYEGQNSIFYDNRHDIFRAKITILCILIHETQSSIQVAFRVKARVGNN